MVVFLGELINVPGAGRESFASLVALHIPDGIVAKDECITAPGIGKESFGRYTDALLVFS